MYIRTKDGRIAEVKENMTIKKCSENVLRLVYEDNRSICVLNGNDDIVKQSENLEELCDEIVYDYRLYQNKITLDSRLVEDSFEELEYPITNEMIKDGIYGAIWTSKGLIYVAKMNSEGKLELI